MTTDQPCPDCGLPADAHQPVTGPNVDVIAEATELLAFRNVFEPGVRCIPSPEDVTDEMRARWREEAIALHRKGLLAGRATLVAATTFKIADRVEWNATGGTWLAATVTEVRDDLLGLTLGENGQPIVVQCRHVRPAGRPIRLTVTCEAGHVVGTYIDSIAEKYPFFCTECDGQLGGKYPWTIRAELAAGER